MMWRDLRGSVERNQKFACYWKRVNEVGRNKSKVAYNDGNPYSMLCSTSSTKILELVNKNSDQFEVVTDLSPNTLDWTCVILKRKIDFAEFMTD